MTFKPNDPLLLVGKILVILGQALMALTVAALLIALPVLWLNLGNIAAEIQTEFPSAAAFPTGAISGGIAIALIMAGLMFFFFRKIMHIIETVGAGDPFAPENANRLGAMAWAMLAVQLLAIPLGGLALYIAKIVDEYGEHADITVDAGLDLSGIIMVVTLFILARVFRHGAAMRDDLEGTV
ncbi:DUF2975 domain-containing protein [Pontixanthobacter sp.]|uniref:DUF2975 domain-containing protein n=1 Tax=Pontixanthobacter sp. TaxID=2792078 RepID=UPI003C7A01F7